MPVRTISTVRDIWLRKDSGKKTSPAWAKANPQLVTKSHEPHSYKEKFGDD